MKEARNQYIQICCYWVDLLYILYLFFNRTSWCSSRPKHCYSTGLGLRL